MSQPPLPPLPWALSTYASPALTMLDSSPGLPHALVVLPGLTDTLGSLPYTDALVRALHPLGVAVVLPQLSSGLGGWGVASVEADAREAAAAEGLAKQQAPAAAQQQAAPAEQQGPELGECERRMRETLLLIRLLSQDRWT